MTTPPTSSFGDPGSGDSGDAPVSRNANVNLTANTSAYQQQMGAAAQSTNQASAAVGGLLTKVDNLFKAGGRGLKILGAADLASITGGVASLGRLDSQLSSLHATAAVNRTSFSQFGNAVDSAFSKFPNHRGDIAALVTQLADLSVKGRDIGGATSALIKLSAATGEGLPQLASGLVTLNRQFNANSASQIGNYSNSLLTVSKSAGVSASGVLQFSSAIAPISKQAGIGEAAVMGISAAFSKAGADGFVAANLYNSIVTDITRLTKTGSPELVKYANLIGKTAGEFKKMPAKEQVAQLFEALGKGGAKADSFVQREGYGIRAQSAAAAVGQSGGVRKYVGMAERASGDQGNLNRGAAAATSGLNDQLARGKNEVTQFVDSLAKPLMGPITGLARGFVAAMSAVNSLAKAFSPLLTIIGGVVAVAAPIAGMALHRAALIGGLALGRMMLGKNGALRTGAADGRATAAYGRANPGLTREQRIAGASTATGNRILAGNALMRNKAAFAMGENTSGQPGLIGTAGRAARYAGRVAGFGAIGGVAGARGFYFGGQSRILRDQGLRTFSRSAYGDRPGVRESFRNFRTTTAARAAGQATLTGGVAREGGALVKSIGGVAVGTAKAGLGLTRAITGAAAGLAVRGTVGRLPAIGGALATGASAVGRGLFSMPGMLALGIGLPLLSGLKGRLDEAHDKSRTLSEGDLNPIKQYNDALGIATGKLADFGTGLDNARGNDKPGTKSVARTFAEAKTITDTEMAKYEGKGASNKGVTALAAHNKNNVQAAVAYMTALGITNPKQLDLLGQDLIAAGFSQTKAQQVLSQYKPGAKVNYAGLADAVNRSEGDGFNPSKTGKSLIGGALGSLSVAKQADVETKGAQYGQAKYLRDSLTFLGAQAGGANNDTKHSALVNSIKDLTGVDIQGESGSGDYSTVEDRVLNQRKFGGTGVRGAPGSPQRILALDKLSAPKRRQAILDILKAAPKGQKFLKGLGLGDINKITPMKLDDVISRGGKTISDTNKATNTQFGALGKFFTTDKTVSAAASDTGGPVVLEKATTSLAAEATKTEGGLSAASGKLLKLSDSLGGAETASGALALAASKWARTLQGFKTPYLSRTQQTQTLRDNYRASKAAADAPGATQATVDQAHADRTALEGQRQSNYQYLISTYQAVKAFGVQRVRSEEDYNTQIYRNNRSFQISMIQSEQDYTKQRARTLEDFNTQQRRAAQSAAESIYSPYQRVQSQSVVNGGMLASNLADENQRIAQQHEQVRKLRASGLSQGAVDTLKLDDPANAQQTNSIARSVINDPAMVRRINRLVAERQHATTRLTQSSFNEDFRNTVKDFQRGLDRTSDDYDTAHDRAVKSQKIALSDMATDYAKMVRRTGEDLTTQMTELYGSYAKLYAKTLAKINKEIGAAFPDLANTLRGQIGDPGGGGSGGGTTGPVGSRSNPNTRAGVTGKTVSGKVGSYDSKGTFHALVGGLGPNPHLQYIAPNTSARTVGGDTLMRIVQGAGFRGDSARIMYGIVLAESGGDRFSHNENYKQGGGDDSYGLAQINMLGAMGPARRRTYGLKTNEDLFNAATNLRVAYSMSGHGSHFGDWSTYNNGAYLNNMPGHKTGGISTKEHVARFSEGNTSEFMVPLDARGHDYMAGMYDRISSMLARRMQHQAPGMRGQSQSHVDARTYHEDHSTRYDKVVVEAADPREMEKKLAERVRLKRLAAPNHAMGG